jgi:hypothetical protein
MLGALVWCLVASGATACGGASDSTADSGRAAAAGRQVAESGEQVRVLTVQATEYSYPFLPDSVAAGPTRIVLQNNGKVRHELALARLRPGVSLSASVDVALRKADPAGVIDSVFGIIVAAPGTAGSDTLKVVLEAGRQYAIVCFLRDAPGKPEHIALGMAESFVAKR